jgi:hypothetical protein
MKYEVPIVAVVADGKKKTSYWLMIRCAGGGILLKSMNRYSFAKEIGWNAAK